MEHQNADSRRDFGTRAWCTRSACLKVPPTIMGAPAPALDILVRVVAPVIVIYGPVQEILVPVHAGRPLLGCALLPRSPDPAHDFCVPPHHAAVHVLYMMVVQITKIP